MNKDIQILAAHVIEQARWDKCVEDNTNGLIYAQYDYLDNICDHWHGIVIGDYEAVMALPWRKKYGFRYYYRPPFVQQLGLIGNTASVDQEHLIRLIRQFAWYGDLFLNFSNYRLAEALKAGNKTNFIITLKSGYDQIYAAYSPDLKQTLQKNNPDFLYTKDAGFLLAIETFQEAYAARMPHISTDEFSRLTVICKQLENRGACLVRAVYTGSGTLLSNALLLKDNKRIYHLFNTTTSEGRKLQSNHWLIDQILKEFAGEKLLFDFEGSELEGIKNFYKKFGGHIQPYFYYKRKLLN